MRNCIGYTNCLSRFSSYRVDINECKLVISLLYILTLNLGEFCLRTKKPCIDGPPRVMLLFCYHALVELWKENK